MIFPFFGKGVLVRRKLRPFRRVAGCSVGELFLAGIVPGLILGAIPAAAANRRLNWADLRDSLYETVRISCMLAWLFFAAQTIIGGYSLAGGTTFV